VFTADPRFVGVENGSSTLSRVATYRSWSVPARRVEANTTSNPSLRTFGWMSTAVGLLGSSTASRGPKLASTSRSLT
jgi:hypothetical protein